MKNVTSSLKAIVIKLENSTDENGTLLQQIFVLDRQVGLCTFYKKVCFVGVTCRFHKTFLQGKA